VANEQGGARLGLQGEHVLTLFDDAVVITLRAARASSPALDGVDRKMLRQGARECGVVNSHRKYTRDDQNRRPFSH
jgi:hypothetical protein